MATALQIPGELVFENIIGGRAHQNKMLGWSFDAQGKEPRAPQVAEPVPIQ